METRRFNSLLTLSIAVLAGQHALADVPPAQTAEVAHLISYLESSDCQMVRNGRIYSGKEGAKHVRRKYDYFRDDLSSTEEFIEYAAARSTTSGRDYEVRCPDSLPRSSRDWLMDELAAYRQARG